MAAIAHGFKPTKLKNPPSRDVAREFNREDQKAKAQRRALEEM